MPGDSFDGPPEGGAIDPLPDEVRRRALMAFNERESGATVADLVHDSLLDDLDEPEDAAVRVLRFSDGDHEVDARVTITAPARRSLAIRLVPARRARITLTSDGWTTQLSTEPDGRAAVEEVPEGLLGMDIAWPDSSAVQTARVRV